MVMLWGRLSGVIRVLLSSIMALSMIFSS